VPPPVRSYGNENWEFNDAGFMRRRYASINDLRSGAASGSSIGRSDARPTTTPA
jgi:uncharacterized protein